MNEPTARPDKGRIIAVDDTPASLRLLTDILMSEGYEVRSAISGELALRAAAAQPPDLILLDIRMPGLSGFEVCRQLKTQEATRDVPVIFVSAMSDTVEKLEGFSLGAVDYVTKPYQREELLARVHSHVELYRLRHHLEELVEQRTHELNTARLQAEAANLAKSRFLSNISHEFRTPMNAILGLTYLMGQETTAPDQAERLGKIDSAARVLLELINNLIDLAEIEVGDLRLEPVDFALDGLMEQLRGQFAPLAARKGLQLNVDYAQVPPCLHGDRNHLLQALRNYLDNALKFTHQGHITLRARQLETHGSRLCLRFEVEDTGVGIAAESLGKIFRAFEQADDSYVRKYEGSGLGLAITRSLAEMMGGEAGVESTPDQGSVFWFTAWLDQVQISAASEPGCEADVPPALPEAARAEDISTTPPVQAGALLDALEILLAESDTDAQQRCQQYAGLLRSTLGLSYASFIRQIDEFEFDAALGTLRHARALAGPATETATESP